MVCRLSDLIALLEQKSGLDLQSMDISDQKCIRARNEELFPFIKDHTVILPSTAFDHSESNE